MTNLLTEDLDFNTVPAKFKDDSGAVRVQAMINSYNELEKKMSAQPSAAPNLPASPDEYCVNCAHGMFQPDPDVNKRLYDSGLSNEQVQAVYDLAAEKLVPMIAELAAEFQADREVEKLVNHFGGAEQWQDVSRQLLAFGQKNLPPEVLRNLSSSYEGVLALYRMMKGEEPSLRRDMANSNPGGLDQAQLSSMMRDPKYWREKDPAVVQKVTDGFKNLYGNQ
ncbi:MAG: hypothetical protein LRY36_00890 [Alphaproteobacteria bacterium]|nr:hypothetical protein [Alphaproteobacteria bacterium]